MERFALKVLEINDKLNAESLSIYSELIKCSRSVDEKYTPQINIVNVFFHEIMKIITSLVFRRVELLYKCQNNGPLQQKLNVFPYIDYLDALHYVSDNKKYSNVSFSYFNKNSIKVYLYNMYKWLKLVKNQPNKIIGITPNAIKYRQIVLNINHKQYNPINLPHTKIQINDFDIQWSNVSEFIDKLTIHTNYIKINDLKGLKLICKKHIKSFIGQENKRIKNLDLLITGTHQHLNNRIWAVNAFKYNIPVITVLHGQSDGFFDEPVFGYGENSYANYILSYGINGFYEIGKSKYTRPITKRDYKIVTTNSDKVKEIYKVKKIDKFKIHAYWLYVPTIFSGLHTYGPYRSIPDRIYAEWQLYILNQLPFLNIKIHDKGVANNYYKIEKNRVHNNIFSKSLNDIDVFVFDYVSTAFTLAASTDKPIIYFDLGLRRFTDSGINFIKERCIYIKISDLKNSGLLETMNKKNAKKSNKNLKDFCLDGTDSSRINKLMVTIDAILK